ncbi:hypothetical protein EON63_13545 [archaeon]|nr:MAG: hypothetical protein EON63_13545 [archaeon]
MCSEVHYTPSFMRKCKHTFMHHIILISTHIFMHTGEGPFNSLGGFFGEKKLLKAPLADWRILRGSAPHIYVYNWGGKISPVVHQLDRFL